MDDLYEALGIDPDDSEFQAALREVDEVDARSAWYECRWGCCSWQYDPVAGQVVGGFGIPLCECDDDAAPDSDRLHKLLVRDW